MLVPVTQAKSNLQSLTKYIETITKSLKFVSPIIQILLRSIPTSPSQCGGPDMPQTQQ